MSFKSIRESIANNKRSSNKVIAEIACVKFPEGIDKILDKNSIKLLSEYRIKPSCKITILPNENNPNNSDVTFAFKTSKDTDKATSETLKGLRVNHSIKTHDVTGKKSASVTISSGKIADTRKKFETCKTATIEVSFPEFVDMIACGITTGNRKDADTIVLLLNSIEKSKSNKADNQKSV